MPFQLKPDEHLSPEATKILEVILEETRGLRELDLADTPPAAVFEAK
jgi:hypothetical protein